ncbi:MAG: hypothetical protein GX241_04940 [Ruminococcaceae bacterium]|nr:hypothetical protein [Oscillospiraceae bacterium]
MEDMFMELVHRLTAWLYDLIPGLPTSVYAVIETAVLALFVSVLIKLGLKVGKWLACLLILLFVLGVLFYVFLQ